MDFIGMLRQAARQRQSIQKRFNPNPVGVMIEGCTTHDVYAFLSRHPGAFFNRQQIILATGRPQKAVDWALIFLKREEKIRSVEDSVRNPRYLRYTVINGEDDKS